VTAVQEDKKNAAMAQWSLGTTRVEVQRKEKRTRNERMGRKVRIRKAPNQIEEEF
jgi:hypothetical protein